MLARTLAFVLGIYCLMQLHWLPSVWIAVSIPLLLILTRYFSGFRIILFFSLGFFWALFRAGLALEHTLDIGIENNEVLIKGTIVSIPETYDDHIRFLLDTKEVIDSKEQRYSYPGTIRLSWYRTRNLPASGETWQFKVKLKRIYGFMNSGGFDYEAWMLRLGIKATGYVKISPENKKLGISHAYFIQNIRYKLAQQLKQSLDKPLLGLVLALSLGDRSQLDAEQWKILSYTGTNHLIAISGLHLSLIAGLVYFLASFFWSQFYYLTQRLPAPVFASVMAFIAAFFYAMLAGFALPAQRALIMIAVFLVALFSARQILISHVICVAVVLVLVLDPFAIIAVDFYLSFIAVIFILYITRFRISEHTALTRWIRLQCMLSFALFPILIFWFKQVPLYSVLANLIAIPVIGFVVVPLILIALILLLPMPKAALALYSLVEKIYQQQWAYLEFLSQQNYAVIPIATPSLFVLILAIVGVLILLMPKGLPARWLGIFFILPLLFPETEKLKQGEFDFNLLDAGQGLAAVIRTKEHVLIYDTGAQFSERFNIGDAVIKPYLRDKGINEISILLVSHGDNDHIGGAKALIKNFKISKILTSVPEKFDELYTEHCYAGQKWTWDDVEFEILHPQKQKLLSGNNASCVLKVSSIWGSVLLTGDIEKKAENRLVEQYKDELHVDILLVPHHGSKTSSTKAFIAAVASEHAFIAAGYRNRFGLPKQDIIARYEAHGVKTRVSFETGELSAKFRDEGLQIDEFRTKNRHFWHH
ncbi:MAG TPA: DNA internalization-related competence protein ComEC/Rec2 [Thiotrichaceae bacterium]|jgi:competence protein ComEC|nr:DNA internalization-related competence protein ComEC/Rec2 [Thiotrichaceae bacterium]